MESAGRLLSRMERASRIPSRNRGGMPLVSRSMGDSFIGDIRSIRSEGIREGSGRTGHQSVEETRSRYTMS